MDLKYINEYVHLSRMALTADCTDSMVIQEIRELMRNLWQYLYCRVCHKLPDRLNQYSDGFACTVCVNHHLTEDTTKSILSHEIFDGYKKLFAYIQITPLYNAICITNEDKKMIELLTEESCLINGHNHLVNDTSNKQQTEVENTHNNIELNSSSYVQLPIKNGNVQSQTHNIQNQTTSILYTLLTDKKKSKPKSCRCGTSRTQPGKMICLGLRCPCYLNQKPCDQCKCQGCRNPKKISSNNDDSVVSLLNPLRTKSKPAQLHYIMHDPLQLPSHSQGETKGTLQQTVKKELPTSNKEKYKKDEIIGSLIKFENSTGKENPEKTSSENLEEDDVIVCNHSISNTIKKTLDQKMMPSRKSKRLQNKKK